MDVFRRENVHKFGEHVLKEGEHSFLARAKDLIGDSPSGPDFVRASGTAEFRVTGESAHHVTWKVNLRNDNDAESGGIGDDVLHLLLSVVATVADAVVAAPVLLDDGPVPERSHLGEFRVLFDFSTPSLIIGQMPVEAVELVHGHDIKVLLDLLDGEEMP